MDERFSVCGLNTEDANTLSSARHISTGDANTLFGVRLKHRAKNERRCSI